MHGTGTHVNRRCFRMLRIPRLLLKVCRPGRFRSAHWRLCLLDCNIKVVVVLAICHALLGVAEEALAGLKMSSAIPAVTGNYWQLRVVRNGTAGVLSSCAMEWQGILKFIPQSARGDSRGPSQLAPECFASAGLGRPDGLQQ